MSFFSQILPGSPKNRMKARVDVTTLKNGLLRMQKNGFNLPVTIDVRPYSNKWTSTFKTSFSTAKILMFQPQKSKQSELCKQADSDPSISFQSKLLGASSLERVAFSKNETTSSVLTETTKFQQAATWLPMTALDEVTKNTEFTCPDFLEWDVQGYEPEVLKGAPQVLAAAQAVLMEVNLLEIIEDSSSFDKTVAFMADRDFRVYNICSFIRHGVMADGRDFSQSVLASVGLQMLGLIW